MNLEIKDGEFVVFVGPSGCGKSTLLRIIAGLEEATAGDVFIGDELANDIPPAKRGTAMVFQSYALYPHMTVAENMGFSLKLAGQPKDEIKASVAQRRGDPPDRAPPRADAPPALRRPAAARRHRPRHRAQAQGVPLRRAALQPRRRPARADAHRARQAARRAGLDHDLRDPRPGRGHDPRRPDRGPERRHRRAGRVAARPLRQPRQPVRGRLPGLAQDELPRRRRRQAAGDELTLKRRRGRPG